MANPKTLFDYSFKEAGGLVTDEGWRVLSLLLDEMGPYPDLTPPHPRSPHDIFMKFMGGKNVPVAIEMILVKDGKAFLTPRDDANWKGPHVPGSYMTPGKSLVENCQRIANTETPGVTIMEARVIGCSIAWDSPRFPDTSAVTVCTFEGEPDSSQGEWYDIMNPPPDLIGCHAVFWLQVQCRFLLRQILNCEN